MSSIAACTRYLGGFEGIAVKRIRRITMEIVQRRAEVRLESRVQSSDRPPASGAGAACELPAACPACGSGWLLLHDPAPGSSLPVLPAVHTAFANLDLHLYGAPDGRLWACRRSFDQFCQRLKETP